MTTELTVLVLVIGSLAVTWVCRRLDISAPLVLVVVGIAASFLPGVTVVEFDPNIVLLLVLTPLLYSAALESSYVNIKANLRPIGLLAVGLPAFSNGGHPDRRSILAVIRVESHGEAAKHNSGNGDCDR